MKQGFSVYLLTTSLVLLLTTGSKGSEAPVQVQAQAERKSPLSLGVVTSIGTYLSPEEPKSSLSLAPTLGYDFGERRFLELYTVVDRPFDAHENFSVPLTILSYGHGVELTDAFRTSLGTSLTALSLDRWAADGHMVRGAATVTVSRELLPGLKAAFKTGPFGQLNKYTQTTSGKALPSWGFTQKVQLTYVWKDFTFDLILLADQKYADRWRNGYGTFEAVTYDLTNDWSVGVSHELLGSVLDDSTGYYKALQVFDERNSRVSAFLEVKL